MILCKYFHVVPQVQLCICSPLKLLEAPDLPLSFAFLLFPPELFFPTCDSPTAAAFSGVGPSHSVPLPLRRDNNFIKDFPQLADGLMVIPLPVEEQCRGVLSEPFPNLQLLTGIACRSSWF